MKANFFPPQWHQSLSGCGTLQIEAQQILAWQVQPRFWEVVRVVSQVARHGEKSLPPFWYTLISNPTVLKLPELKVHPRASPTTGSIVAKDAW